MIENRRSVTHGKRRVEGRVGLEAGGLPTRDGCLASVPEGSST